MGKFSFLSKAAKWGTSHADEAVEMATHGGGSRRVANGMPSFGGGHAPHMNGRGYGRPSMLGRAMDFVDMAGGVGGMINGATDIAAYGDMSMDGWNAFSDVMKEGFNAHTVGELGGVVAEGIVYNKLQDFGIPAPVALMLTNCAQKFIEDFADKHHMAGGAAEVATSDHPDTKKTVASQHPQSNTGDAALKDGHQAGVLTTAALGAAAISSDPENMGMSQMTTSQALAASAIASDPEQSVKSQLVSEKTWKSEAANWLDGAGMVVGQIPVVGDIAGGVLGAAGAGMRYADGDTKGAAMSLAGAGANLLPGPTGLLANGEIAAYEVADGAGAFDGKQEAAPAAEQTKAVAFSSGGTAAANPSAEVANALKAGGFDLSSLISGGSNIGDDNRMNLAGCKAPGMAQSYSRGFSLS